MGTIVKAIAFLFSKNRILVKENVKHLQSNSHVITFPVIILTFFLNTQLCFFLWTLKKWIPFTSLYIYKEYKETFHPVCFTIQRFSVFPILQFGVDFCLLGSSRFTGIQSNNLDTWEMHKWTKLKTATTKITLSDFKWCGTARRCFLNFIAALKRFYLSFSPEHLMLKSLPTLRVLFPLSW